MDVANPYSPEIERMRQARLARLSRRNVDAWPAEDTPAATGPVTLDPVVQKLGRDRRFAKLLLGLPVRPYLRGVRQLRDALLGVGYRLGGNLRYLEEEGGEHNELAWSRRLPGALRFLLL